MENLEIRRPTRNIFKILWRHIRGEAHKAWKKIDRDDVLSEVNQLGFDIFKITLYDDNNVKYLSPKNTDKMYIVTKQYVMSKDISTFIVFEHSQGNNSSKLTIVNHDYKYDFDIPSKTADIMKDMFENKVEADRNSMEKEILSNITMSLAIVLADFKDKLANGKN